MSAIPLWADVAGTCRYIVFGHERKNGRSAQMSDQNGNSKRHRRLIAAAQIAVIAVWIASILILVPTFLNFLATECGRGVPRMPEYFVCFPPG